MVDVILQLLWLSRTHGESIEESLSVPSGGLDQSNLFEQSRKPEIQKQPITFEPNVYKIYRNFYIYNILQQVYMEAVETIGTDHGTELVNNQHTVLPFLYNRE